jgi:hypothetical protein
MAVGSTTPDLVGEDGHGPPHPWPIDTFHRPRPTGVMRTASPAVTAREGEAPETVNAEPDVTITVWPSFSVRATRTWVDAWLDRPVNAVPP